MMRMQHQPEAYALDLGDGSHVTCLVTFNFSFFHFKMNELLKNLLYAVQCLQSLCCVSSTAPSVPVQNELGNINGEAVLST